MKTNEIIEDLKSIDKNVFKYLHKGYRFDFEKDFVIREIPKPFTALKVVKLLDPIGWNINNPVNNNRIVVLLVSEKTRQYRHIHGVEIVHTGLGDSQDFRLGTRSYLSQYYTVSDFSNARKSYSGLAYVIMQKDELLTPAKGKTTEELFNRLTKEEYERWYKDDGDYDKSGYPAYKKREELKKKARELREERAKAAFAATDNRTKIEELKKRVEVAKTVMIERFNIANTYETISRFRNDVLYDAGYMYRYLEELVKGEREKSFGSIEEFDRACQNVERYARNIITGANY